MHWQSILWHAINVLYFGCALGMYFVPSFVAVGKRKPNVRNLLLGWTAFVWVLALIWAVSIDVPAPGPSADLPE